MQACMAATTAMTGTCPNKYLDASSSSSSSSVMVPTIAENCETTTNGNTAVEEQRQPGPQDPSVNNNANLPSDEGGEANGGNNPNNPDDWEDALLYWVDTAENDDHDQAPDEDDDAEGEGELQRSEDIPVSGAAPPHNYNAHDNTSNNANNSLAWQYQQGLMKSVHMEVQENAKIPVMYEDYVHRTRSNNNNNNNSRFNCTISPTAVGMENDFMFYNNRHNTDTAATTTDKSGVDPIATLVECDAAAPGCYPSNSSIRRGEMEVEAEGGSGKNRNKSKGIASEKHITGNDLHQQQQEQHVNLAENFLKSQHRISKTLNYGAAGELSRMQQQSGKNGLTTNIANFHNDTTTALPTSSNHIDIKNVGRSNLDGMLLNGRLIPSGEGGGEVSFANNKANEPPEIASKSNQRSEGNSLRLSTTTKENMANSSRSAIGAHQLQQQQMYPMAYYLYGRHVPLPIPSPPSPPTACPPVPHIEPTRTSSEGSPIEEIQKGQVPVSSSTTSLQPQNCNGRSTTTTRNKNNKINAIAYSPSNSSAAPSPMLLHHSRSNVLPVCSTGPAYVAVASQPPPQPTMSGMIQPVPQPHQFHTLLMQPYAVHWMPTSTPAPISAPTLPLPSRATSPTTTTTGTVGATLQNNNVFMTNSIKEAAMKQNQFGFGSHHFVPSVPIPPMAFMHQHQHQQEQQQHLPFQEQQETTHSSTMRNCSTVPYSISSPRQKKPRIPISDPTSNNSISEGNANPNNNGDCNLPPSVTNIEAYERKKLKAKDGRARLNDSIEHLAIAINVAGSQSKKRSEQLSLNNDNDNNNDSMNDAHSLMFEPTTLQIMIECETAATLAKKYDRPSFVASAATLVRALNDQCEALTREVQQLRKRCSRNHHDDSNIAPNHSSTLPNGNVATVATTATASIGDFCQSAGEYVDPGTLSMVTPERTSTTIPIIDKEGAGNGILGIQGCDAKKRKMFNSAVNESKKLNMEGEGITKNTDCFAAIVPHDPVLKAIASFLAPMALVRCRVVSKYWKAIDAFTCDGIWHILCNKRFGKEKLAICLKQTSIVGGAGSSKRFFQLYKKMSLANTSPFTTAEGNLRLGEAKLAGVSAWASMVARSNGETLISVKDVNASYRKCPPSALEGGNDSNEYASLPVVELRIVVQNTGNDNGILVPDQSLSVDSCTRRRTAELFEASSYERLQRRIMKLDGTPYCSSPTDLLASQGQKDKMIHLRLFDSIVLKVHIHARGCPTTNKFLKMANYTKLLVTSNGATFPVVIPFPSTKILGGIDFPMVAHAASKLEGDAESFCMHYRECSLPCKIFQE